MKTVLIIALSLLSLIVVFQMISIKTQKGIETYPYKVIKKYDKFEVRSYEPSLFTSVQIPSRGYRSSSSNGFRILAGYIFGQNETNEKIAMTSPVTMSLEDTMTMMFMVPRSIKKEDLPRPSDSQIKFIEVPKKNMAAITFGGWANDAKIEKYKNELIEELKSKGLKFTNKFYFFGYNPPYEVVNRKNEVVIELEEDFGV